jgi:hypothetical protein
MNFKEEYTINTIKTYMKKYNLEGWSYRINKRKCGGGVCKYRSKIIEVSHYYINNPNITKKDIKNTIIHEIAHALTRGHGHDNVWMKKFKSMGGNGSKYCKHFSSYYSD